MAELKTKKNDASVPDFLDAIEDPQRQADCRQVSALMERVLGEPPVMWGKSIVGFGAYDYKYASGREGRWMAVGFAPRKRDLTLYIMSGFGAYEDLMGRLGKHKTGKSCLYIKRLSDVDTGVLEELVRQSVDALSNRVMPA